MFLWCLKKSKKQQQRKAIKMVKSHINQIRNNICLQLEIFKTNVAAIFWIGFLVH
jgi:hypothetical protein